MEPTPSSACAAEAVSAQERSSNASERPHDGCAKSQRWFNQSLYKLAVLVFVAGCLLATASCSTDAEHAAGMALDSNATVVRVVDGDTIVVRSHGEQERVRLIGINTPESVDPSRPVMCYGKEASARLKEVLKAGTPIQLRRDVEARDRYERLLAYVFRASDGLFVNLEMVRGGFADQYRFPPNTAYESQFSEAASAAHADGLGAWTACDKPFKE